MIYLLKMFFFYYCLIFFTAMNIYLIQIYIYILIIIILDHFKNYILYKYYSYICTYTFITNIFIFYVYFIELYKITKKANVKCKSGLIDSMMIIYLLLMFLFCFLEIQILSL